MQSIPPELLFTCPPITCDAARSAHGAVRTVPFRAAVPFVATVISNATAPGTHRPMPHATVVHAIRGSAFNTLSRHD